MSTREIIAREVGVSAQTVSNVLNGKNKETWGVTAQRAARIREVAARVGYKPNAMARAVATGKSRLIGLVMHINSHGYMSEIENGILKEISAQGFTSRMMYFRMGALGSESDAFEDRIAEQCREWKVEGVIAICIHDSEIEELKRRCDEVGCPVAFVGGIPPEGMLGVFTDSRAGVHLGVEYLASLGHRRISYLSGNPGSSITDRQIESFGSVMREFGLPFDETNIAIGDWTDAEVIAVAANRLLDLPERPTAIFCNSAIQAMIVMRVAMQRQVQIPQDLSLICYGTDVLLNYTTPPITSIVQPFDTMGHRVVKELLSHIENPDEKEKPHPVCLTEGIRMIVRGSTAPPKL